MGKREKAAAAVLGTLAAAGLVTGATIESPALLLDDSPIVIEEEIDESAPQVVQLKSRGFARVRQWILGLPAAVRMLVAIPLWCVGWVVENGLSAFLLSPAAPVLQRLVAWLSMGLLLWVVFTTSAKCAFPKFPLKKLFRLRNLLLPLAVAVVLGAADMALPTVWESYNDTTRLLWRVGSAVLLGYLCSTTLRFQGKRYARETAVPLVEERTEIEREAWRLADTVCPKR